MHCLFQFVRFSEFWNLSFFEIIKGIRIFTKRCYNEQIWNLLSSRWKTVLKNMFHFFFCELYFITHKKSHHWSFLNRQSCIWNMEIAQICHQYAETREGRQWIPISIERHHNNCNSCCCEDVSLKSPEKECIVSGVCSRRIASCVDNNAAGVLIKSYLVYRTNNEMYRYCHFAIKWNMSCIMFTHLRFTIHYTA